MKKKISIITLVMAMLLAVGGFTTSTAVSAKNKKVKCLGTYKITAYCGCRSCSGKWGTELLQVAEQNKAEPFLLIGEKLS